MVVSPLRVFASSALMTALYCSKKCASANAAGWDEGISESIARGECEEIPLALAESALGLQGVDLRGSHPLPKLRIIHIDIDAYDAAVQLAAKTPLRRRAIQLRAEGMSYESIAETLSINFRTARKLFHD